ncbi:ATP synthase F0 subunit 6 (mitochondrion) [Diaphorina citri]|uniref:ATP synthase subunit a n=1 Tax=Diaphorina citri TaxID=121845 RepID=A0A1X9QGZ8_DIACI|nr:ATP synthase F0 subunit 6 [Diaphorina citri]ANC65504.1 ATP synthase F0 subunit 6 [Diaphorina citri]AOW71068.1 ATP synthase F0 subunit 6 [Diaphorina citri]ARQ27116.1 ATP synthase F0 subunit 6 [Diaphorina citri]ARQ27129.1 ATP synthase F0 subunit 6 [Diaphorina citri]ATD85655.1 ATP synthase F0 subunit 6 [Diaphorina citri]
MMTSLFSMFDPMTMSPIPMNWMSMILPSILLPLTYWKLQSRTNILMKKTMTLLNNEFSSLFMKTILMKGTTLIPITLFFFILISNISSNFPYSFCCSAHLTFSLSLALPIWVSIVMFFWVKLTKTTLSHLVPSGTPNILMPMMVVIEMTSNIIRPMALAVRLTANLIAGHLLMALLGNTLNIKNYMWLIILFVQTAFMMFELMVAIIQSYVFSVLMTLYSSEIS